MCVFINIFSFLVALDRHSLLLGLSLVAGGRPTLQFTGLLQWLLLLQTQDLGAETSGDAARRLSSYSSQA